MTQDGKPIEYSSLKKSHKRRLEHKSEQAVQEKSSLSGWDPRFDDSCGKLDKKQFHQAYAFVDDLKRVEKAQIKKQLEEIDEDLKEKQSSTNEFDYNDLLHDRKKALRKQLRSFQPSWLKRKNKQRRRSGRQHTPGSA